MSRRSRPPRWSSEPDDPVAFTHRHDRLYTRFAEAYGIAVPRLPIWKTWLHAVLPHLRGPRVLEVAIGPGYLLTQYARRFEAVGLDLNPRMLRTAHAGLEANGLHVPLVRADAAHLPFCDESFDCVLSTMALSGLPRAMPALEAFRRVLRPRGTLVLLDVSFPRDGNVVGRFLTELWRLAGDVIRDVGASLGAAGFQFDEQEIGGFGSVHLYVARRT